MESSTDKTDKREIEHINTIVKSGKEKKKVAKHMLKKEVRHEKHERHQVKKKEPTKRPVWPWLVILAAAVIIVVVALLLRKPASVQQDKIAAVVNGENITLKDLQEQYSKLPAQYQGVYTLRSYLNQTIDELLLIQDARKHGVTVSDEDVQTALDAFLDERNLTEADLQGLLAQQNINVTYFKELVRKQLIISRLFNETIFNNIDVSDEDARQFYDDNKDLYAVPEQVTVRHILVQNTTRSLDEAHQLILDAQDLAKTKDFCDLVKNFSEDPGSVNTCGEYTFGRGYMVPEFENASFSLKDGKMAIVQTAYGYHLIKKMNSTPEGFVPFSEVKAAIKAQLQQSKGQDAYTAYIAELRSSASIQINPEQNSIPVPESIDAAQLAACLSTKDVKMYGAYWCGHCANQKQLFGDAFPQEIYVECATQENPQAQTPACIAAGIQGYPTWVIDGKQYPGEQSLERLKTLAGC